MTPAAAALAADFGRPSALKRGRDPRWPYVPVILHSDKPGGRQEQIVGRAFATRQEAVEYSMGVIAARRASLASRLAMPNHRLLRELHGVSA